MKDSVFFYRLVNSGDDFSQLQTLSIGGLAVQERIHKQLQALGFVHDKDASASSYLEVDANYQYSLKFFQPILDHLKQNQNQTVQFVDENEQYLPIRFQAGTPIQNQHVKDVQALSITKVLNSNDVKTTQRICEDFFFDEMLKSSEGLVSKEVNKKYSFAWSRYLARTPITPNQLTAITLVSGLFGSYLLMFQNYFLVLLGAFILQWSSIVDGCDGEIAKLKVLSSKWGGWFDTIADDIVNTSMFVCLWVGWYKASPSPQFYDFLMVSTVARVILSALMYVHRLKNNTLNTEDFKLSENDPKQDSQLLYVLKRIMKRDFIIFLAFVMVLVGQAHAMSALLITCTWVAFAVIFIAIIRMSVLKLLKKN